MQPTESTQGEPAGKQDSKGDAKVMPSAQLRTAQALTPTVAFRWTVTKPGQGNGGTKNNRTKRAAAFLRMSRTHCQSQVKILLTPRSQMFVQLYVFQPFYITIPKIAFAKIDVGFAKSKGQPHQNHKCSSSDEGCPNQGVPTRLYQTSLPAALREATKHNKWQATKISKCQ